jgi:DNA repair exonuclease SbcCD ATPase subunit
VEGLSEALAKSTGVKDALVQELSTVQGRQREVAGQLSTAEHQIAKLGQAFAHIEERRDQVAFAERRMGTFEGRLRDLETLAGAVETRMAALTDQSDTLDALRREVDGVHDVAARSKADLEHLEAQRGSVAMLRSRVDELLATARATDERLADINARRRVVDEVQLKVNVITAMLDDVRVNLETVGEQRAILDHVLANLAKLDDMTQTAQGTLRSLQAERALAERIEQSIKTLRSRTTLTERKQA